MGGSLSKSIRYSVPKIQIAAFDKKTILKNAEAENSIDFPLSNPLDALNYDVIFLALPIDESLKYFRELSPLLKRGQVICDLCSVKGVFVDVWRELKSEGIYVGTHPMTGKEKGGHENSDSLLFENTIMILSDHCKEDKSLSGFFQLLKNIGCRITFLDPYLHDEIASKVSHLPQLLSVLLVLQAAQNKDGVQFIDFVAGGFRDMTRIASSEFTIWESILKHNKKLIIESLDLFREELKKLEELIFHENSIELKRLFETAHKIREETPINNKGFIDPLFDITVFIKDEPGMISKISTILYENNINIKDIELLKIREGSGGNFKLYFEIKTEAERAKQILEGIGFKAN